MTISVSTGQPDPPEPQLVTMPNVIGRAQGTATATLTNLGFTVVISYEQECDPSEAGVRVSPGRRLGAGSPAAALRSSEFSTVTVPVNP